MIAAVAALYMYGGHIGFINVCVKLSESEHQKAFALQTQSSEILTSRCNRTGAVQSNQQSPALLEVGFLTSIPSDQLCGVDLRFHAA